MANTNEELLEIRNDSYRVVHVEVCMTCRHWHRLCAMEHGLCLIGNAGDVLSPRQANPLGTCDLWEGKPSDK